MSLNSRDFIFLRTKFQIMSIKETLLNICKENQLESIKNLKLTMDEAQKSANDYGAPKDRYDAYRTQMMRKRDMMAQQLQKANEQFELLDRIDGEKEYDKVEFGALVITDKQKLFVSVSLGKITVESEDYYAISPAVPVYQAMEGKKAGEEFEFRGNTMKIVEIL